MGPDGKELPSDQQPLHRIITTLSDIAPTWLLFDADWMHTLQSEPYILRLQKIVSVGRLKWIEGSKHTGKDNAAWHLFYKSPKLPAHFHGRTSR